MNKRQKEVLQSQLDAEMRTLRELKQVYRQALRDCETKIRELSARTDMENLQSIIYQKRYQEALKGQLEGVMTSLQSNSYSTVSDYLARCYQDGYIGAMYDLHGQGIPIITPIDQKAVTRAIQTDSKISQGLYIRLGEDVKSLKTSIRAELSRGIANGSSWNEVAGKLGKAFKNTPFSKAYNNSMRIVRTEGHRVQIQSAMDVQRAAKDKGADVVKQWDATLDDRTRETHRMLDGQIRELDEPFEVGGMRADAPGMFNNPAEDCNCRCALLQRAKWALNEDELKTLQKRAEYFELDKTKDFEEFKGKYLQLPDNADKIKLELTNLQDVQIFSQLKQYMKDQYDIVVDSSVEKLNFQTVKKTLIGVEGVFKDYPELGEQVKTISTDKMGVMCCSGTEIYFNPKYYQDETAFVDMCKRCSNSGWWPANSSASSIGAHETGHAVEMLLLNLCNYDYDWERVIDWNKGKMSGRIVSQALKNIKKTEYGKGKKNAELMQDLSGYGATKKQECFAEAFADVASNGDKANPLSIEIKKLAQEKYQNLKGK